jgi:single-strand DNA-binding protein
MQHEFLFVSTDSANMGFSTTFTPCGNGADFIASLYGFLSRDELWSLSIKSPLGTWEFASTHHPSGSMSRFTRDTQKEKHIMHNFKNNVHLEGNLGKDAEHKTTTNGEVTNFSIAVNKRWKDKKTGENKERKDWFEIEAWGPRARFAATLKKGTAVIVEGEIHIDDSEKDGVKYRNAKINSNSIRKIDYSSGEESGGANEEA